MMHRQRVQPEDVANPVSAQSNTVSCEFYWMVLIAILLNMVLESTPWGANLLNWATAGVSEGTIHWGRLAAFSIPFGCTALGIYWGGHALSRWAWARWRRRGARP